MSFAESATSASAGSTARLGGGILLGLYGLNTSSGMVAYQTVVQREVPSSLRGRAFALLDVVWQPDAEGGWT